MDQPDRKQRFKKWLTFAVRWGIAIAGITIVLWNISFHDRVALFDAATGTVQKPRVLSDAEENSSAYTIVPLDGGEPRAVSREEVWVRPDRASVHVRGADGGVRKAKLVAVKPGDWVGPDRGVRQVLVEGADDKLEPLDVARVVEGPDLRAKAPFVEVGINRLLRQADTGLLLVAVFMLPLNYVLTSVRWHLLLESLGIRIGPFRALVINLVGAFYNAFMPGTTGGDLVKAYYAARHTDLRTRAVLSVLIDRVVGLLALMILGGAAAAYQWHIPDCRRVAVLTGILLGSVAVGGIVFYSRRLRRYSGLDFLLRRLPMQRQVHKAVEAMEIYRHRPLALLVALLMSFPAHAISIMSATFAGRAFGLKLDAFYYWVVVPVVALVGAIPISPQGAGVMEFFAVELTRRHGVSISQAFILTMSIRLIQVFWNLVSGVFVLTGGYQRPSEKETAALESDAAAAPEPDMGDAGDPTAAPDAPDVAQSMNPHPRTS